MIIVSYEKGGFKDVDLESKFQSLRIIWFRKMLDKANSHPWTFFQFGGLIIH